MFMDFFIYLKVNMILNEDLLLNFKLVHNWDVKGQGRILQNLNHNYGIMEISWINGMYKEHQWTSIWGETEQIFWAKPLNHVFFLVTNLRFNHGKSGHYKHEGLSIKHDPTWVCLKTGYTTKFMAILIGEKLSDYASTVFSSPGIFRYQTQIKRVTSAIWGKPSRRKHISIFSMVNLISWWIPPINPFFSIFIHRFLI